MKTRSTMELAKKREIEIEFMGLSDEMLIANGK